MLNRRTLRIKVMQGIYSSQLNDTLKSRVLEANIERSIRNTYQLHLYNLLVITRVAGYVVEDEKRRARKHLQTNKSSHFSTRIATAPFVQYLSENVAFNAALKQEKLVPRLDKSVTRKLYQKLSESDTYQKYCAKETVSDSDHRRIIRHLFKKVMLPNEVYQAHLDDTFISWIDDEKSIASSVTNAINSFQVKDDRFTVLLSKEEWNERTMFFKQLLYKTQSNYASFSEMISPQLENWEIERVTTIDTILMMMALCELMFFPTIPVKVSINEYIDISKIYSTPKSKDFINGILDKLMKKLKDEGRIQKTGRGLVGG
ncbi:MAG: transcription antitermination factor NusB [Chitinophagales bacterium]